MQVTASTPAIVILVAIAVLIVAVLVFFAVRRHRRTADLRRRYGPDYDRAVQKSGSRRRAERELLARETQIRRLTIRDLPPAERDHFAERWALLQSHFVDSPTGAIGEADELICSVMKSRGYPASGIEDCAAGIFVNHPDLAADYRAARGARVSSGKRAPTTEDLRTALIHYRALFNDLVGSHAGEDSKAA
ncbi:MAG: hypothetical protein ACREHF_07595 [Rhizomicrobium sp.]